MYNKLSGRVPAYSPLGCGFEFRGWPVFERKLGDMALWWDSINSFEILWWKLEILQTVASSGGDSVGRPNIITYGPWWKQVRTSSGHPRLIKLQPKQVILSKYHISVPEKNCENKGERESIKEWIFLMQYSSIFHPEIIKSSSSISMFQFSSFLSYWTKRI